MTDKDIEYAVGSGNIYADLDYEQPEEMQAKAELVFRLARIIETPGMTQVQAAEILGIPQPKVSALLRGQFSGFSLERILRLLIALDNVDRTYGSLADSDLARHPRGEYEEREEIA